MNRLIKRVRQQWKETFKVKNLKKNFGQMRGHLSFKTKWIETEGKRLRGTTRGKRVPGREITGQNLQT
ncbi:hypothetical protein EI200_02825 [Peribacillus simplex]|uniref:hypothetical protein n=1 Tax=Peribacillus simplex TaxID=1478 RepID=UPI000F63C289|nr:hypothetical protein [Peribacillus simplex]RRN74252.1 hypothetical protein EI200_02825 [Peribacillus simplex]